VYAVQSDSLFAVKETGGVPRALAAAPAGAAARWPVALEASNVVLFAANQRTGESVRVFALSLTVTGPGERMGDGVKMNPTGFGLGYAVMSPSGDLVYVNESSAGLLTYRDAEGRLSLALPDTLAFEHPRFSPDARHLVVTIVDSATSRRTLHVLDRSNGFFSPLAGQDPSSGRDCAEWSPDGVTSRRRSSGRRRRGCSDTCRRYGTKAIRRFRSVRTAPK
jgi:hypothetical protein